MYFKGKNYWAILKHKHREETRPDTRHKMRLVCVFSPSKITRDGPTDGRTDTTSFRDATAHLKIEIISKHIRVTYGRTDGQVDRHMALQRNMVVFKRNK